jgi:hypothetical protein
MLPNTPPGGLVGVAVIGRCVSWSFPLALTVRPEVLLVVVLHQTDHPLQSDIFSGWSCRFHATICCGPCYPHSATDRRTTWLHVL